MSILYDGSFGIVFYDASSPTSTGAPISYRNRYDTWDDLHLVPVERPKCAVPNPLVNVLSVVGSSKRLDLTDIGPGGLRFENRTGQWGFIVDSDYWNNLFECRRVIESIFHGKRLYCVLKEDTSVVYYGRFKIEDWEVGPEYPTFSISYSIDYDSYVNRFVD